MAAVIRLRREGTKNTPFYRIVVTDKKARRDGPFVELLGYYNPIARGKELPFQVNLDRVDYWTKIGAKPSETVASIIKKARKAAKASTAEAAASQS